MATGSSTPAGAVPAERVHSRDVVKRAGRDCGIFTMACDRAGNACNNACFHINCQSGGAASRTMVYDGTNDDTRNRAQSGCEAGRSVCNVMPFSQAFHDPQDNRLGDVTINCDEWPMALTKQGDFVPAIAGGSQLAAFIQGYTPTRGQGKTCPGAVLAGDFWQVEFDLVGADPRYCTPTGGCANDQYQFHMTAKGTALDFPYNPGAMNRYTQEGTGGKDLLQCSVTVHRVGDKAFNIAVFDNTGTKRGENSLSSFSNGGYVTVTGLPATLRFTRIGPYAESGAGNAFLYNSPFPVQWFGDTQDRGTKCVEAGLTGDTKTQSIAHCKMFCFHFKSPEFIPHPPSYALAMATMLPPPSKRRKTIIAEKARAQQDVDSIPSDLGSVRVQFFDHLTKKPTGAPVVIPVADATVKNLELIVNTLQGRDATERVSYRFFYRTRSKVTERKRPHSQVMEGDGAPGQLKDIVEDLHQPVHNTGVETTEDTIGLDFEPQAIFHVRAVTRCSASIPGHGKAILAASFSPSTASRMVTGSGDNTARIFDTDTGTPLHTLKGHTSWVLVVCWSPDDATIATGSMDNTVRLWDPKTGLPLGQPLKGHSQWIHSLAWEPYHLRQNSIVRLASSSKDTTVRIWDTVLKRIDLVLSGHKSSVSCVRWGGTGIIYTASHDKTIKLWDSTKGTLISTLSAHAHWVNHLALSTDLVLRTAYHDHTGQIPSTDVGKIAKAKERYEKAATVNNRITERLVTASDDNTIFLWDPLVTTKPLVRLLGHQKQVRHVTFSPDGARIASSGFDNAVKLWNAHDGKLITTLRGHVGAVYISCFSPDARWLVSGSKDTTLKVWDVQTGKLKQDLPEHHDEVYAVDWSPDGSMVGSGGKDKAVKLWRF
ncbi:MAG: hypothetical protein Q9184_005506 [Pyrenodesmia sp. 2 TL-2023]